MKNNKNNNNNGKLRKVPRKIGRRWEALRNNTIRRIPVRELKIKREEGEIEIRE